MHLREVDKQKPYLFVSYANADRVQVHADVQRLQEAGLNIWIDAELNRYTGANWEKMVEFAMINSACKAILFFVSRFSLSSDAVKMELDLSHSRNVRGMHVGEKLPIIPIRVTAFNSITDFCHKTIQEFGDKVATSELPTSKAFKPAQNAIDILDEYFSGDKILHTSIYDQENIQDVVKSLKKYGLEADTTTIQGIEKSNINIKILMEQGRVYKRQGDIKQAIEYFEQAAVYRSSQAYMELGRIYADSKNYTILESKIAQSCLIRAIDLGLKETKFDLALLLFRIGEKERAKKYLEDVRMMDIYRKNKKIREKCDELM